MLTKKRYFLILVPVMLYLSCASGGTGAHSAMDTAAMHPQFVPDNTLAKGVITDSVTCRNDGKQTYALYLPSYYDAGKQYPCIYFFDAHARGSLPLNLYKDLAEKYGFVMVGSNLSKNGVQWTVTEQGIRSLMDDTRSRISINPKLIYTSGFSGGSRVASSVAIFDGGVAGVIGCAAGFPSVDQGIAHRFEYFGMVGDYDFNMIEMEQLDGALEQSQFTHQLLTTSGIHGWAPAADYETAMLWMQVTAMKEGLMPKNDTLIEALKTDFDSRIGASVKGGEWIRAHELLGGMVRTFNGLADVSSYSKQLTDLDAGESYKTAFTVQATLEQSELRQQQELARQFMEEDEGWWAKKIAGWNENIHGGKPKQEAQMYSRLLNYLGLVSFMSINHALNSGEPDHASAYLKIFKLADPKNPDCSYLTAMYHMQKGESAQAIASLKEAAAAGYSELATLSANPAFNSLHNDPGYLEVINKVWANNKIK